MMLIRVLVLALSLAWACSGQVTNSQVVAWDWNAYGQASVPAGLTNVVAIAAGYADTKVLNADGTVGCWGSYWNNSSWVTSTVPAYVSNVVLMASGDSHAVGLRRDGTVIAWGDNSVGQLNVPAGLSNVVAVACGGWHSMALKNDGTLVGWGTTIPAGLSNVVAMAGGEYFDLALKADGTVVGWGDNSQGQATAPADLTNAVAIAAGFYHSLALRPDGTVVAWGAGRTNSGNWPDFGQAIVPAGLSNVVAISAAGYHSMALRADGIVFAWGEEGDVPAISNVVAIAAGGHHCVALVGGGAPVFTVRPTDRTVTAGSTVYIRAAANGSLPLGYRWQFGGADVPGAATGLLTLTNVQLAQSGTYSVTISNTFGAISSDLSLNIVPFYITGQPQGQAAVGGDTVVLSITAVGQALTYQWLFNGTNLAGQTGTSLTLTNLQLNQAGSYSVLVSNSYGAALSAPAALSVAPFFITNQPQTQTLYSGTNVTFTTGVQGQGPFAYQWLLDGTILSGATAASLTLTNVQPGDAGNYSVQIANSFGALLSSNALLTVQTAAPVLLSQPASRSVFRNGGTTFTVSATGSLPLTYQWQFDGTNLPGATSPSLVLTNLQATNAGTYLAVVTNPYGMTNSASATLSLLTLACWGNNTFGQTNVPAVPGPVSMVAAGYYHNLALRADGTVLAWGAGTNFATSPARGQACVPAAATNIMMIAAGGYHSLALSSNGNVLVWGDNTYGQTNLPANLTNIIAVSAGGYHSLGLAADGSVRAWGRNLESQANVPPGLSNVLAVAAGGLHSLALKRDGTVVAWGNNTVGQIKVPAGLSNVVAIAAGSAQSLALRSDGTLLAWGSISANPPPGLSNVVAISAGGGFSPDFTDSYSLALRSDGSVVGWGYPNSFHEAPPPAGLNDALAVAAGGYHSLVLLGDGRPSVVRPPVSQVIYAGGSMSLAVSTISPAPLAYQWQCNGTNIDGATNAVLVLTNAPLTAQGAYRVVLSNAFGSVTSPAASLQVLRSQPRFFPGIQCSTLGASLQVTNLSGHGLVIILGSSDLATWQPLLTNPPVLGTFQWLDSSATNASTRFYRVVEQ